MECDTGLQISKLVSYSFCPVQPGSTEPRYGLDHFGFEVDDMSEVTAHLSQM